MILGKSIQWHYDACIEQWNWMAENNTHKIQFPLAIEYNANHSCFMCELYKPDYCINCPFVKQYGYYDDGTACECHEDSPYRLWKNSFGSSESKNHAIALAQLIIDHYPIDHYPIDYASFDKNLKWKKFKAERVKRYNSENLTNYSGYSELCHKLTLKGWTCAEIGKLFNSPKETIKGQLNRMNVRCLPAGGSHSRKLTEAQAKTIKCAETLAKKKELCAKYKVSNQIIYNISSGSSWAHI